MKRQNQNKAQSNKGLVGIWDQPQYIHCRCSWIVIEGAATAANANISATVGIFITPDAITIMVERANASEIDLEMRPKVASLPDKPQTARREDM